MISSSSGYFVNILAMADTINDDGLFRRFVNDPVVANSHFPVPFQGLAQRLSVGKRTCQQAGFNGVLDPFLDVLVDFRQILGLDVGVIGRKTRPFSPRPLCG